MQNQKQYCENLYKEYKELLSNTQLHAEFVIPGKELNPQYIKPEDLIKCHEVQKELVKKCKPFLDLNPEEWFEIERD